MDKPIYFAGLNGLRAIAALSVVISHIFNALGDFGLNPYVLGRSMDGNPFAPFLGGHGVTVFFVLSGFLITYLLLVEKRKANIDIKKFYVRRILRIGPLYYLYFIVILVTLYVFKNSYEKSAIWYYVFYSAHIPYILGMAIPLLQHYWSLGVEEWFYLFWPWIVKKVNSWLLPKMIMLASIFFLLKLILHFTFPGSIIEQVLHVTRFHCMMIGGIGAIFLFNKNRIIHIIDNKFLQAVAWLIFILISVGKFHIASVIDEELIALATICIIIGQLGLRNRLINLEKPIFDFLGKISYGIYVIHPLVIFLLSKLQNNLLVPVMVKYLIVFSSVISITILLSYISYHHFESYFLRLKKKFVIVNSRNSRAT